MFDYSYFPKLETDRLLLRQMSAADTADVFAMFSQPQVLTHLELEPFTEHKQATELIQWYNDMFDNKQAWRWGVILKAENKLIGTAGFHRWVQADRRCEIGYDYDLNYWGQGYATEVTKRMVQFGFEAMQLNRIEADCNDDNFGSARVLEKSGFTLEGIWRDRIWEKGKFISLKQFGFLNSEYRTTDKKVHQK
jgi:ribosomal-protein-alanine N-acetyltransferase